MRRIINFLKKGGSHEEDTTPPAPRGRAGLGENTQEDMGNKRRDKRKEDTEGYGWGIKIATRAG